jgi:hypothetical protein
MWLFGYFLHVSEGVRSCRTFWVVMLSELREIHGYGLRLICEPRPAFPFLNSLSSSSISMTSRMLSNMMTCWPLKAP